MGLESLVAVLVAALLMAAAYPDRRTCRTNMQTIANAVQAARIRSRDADYGRFITSNVMLNDDVTWLLGGPLACPKSKFNKYRIENGSKQPKHSRFRVGCSERIHATFEPGVDK